MKRGDTVTVSAPGAYGKPRPAVVVQSDRLIETDSVIVCLMTSEVCDVPIYRLSVHPSPGNGLRAISQVMVDKTIVVPRTKCGSIIGRLEQDTLAALNRTLSLMLGIAD